MLFSSIPFLYYFLPAVLILYFAVPRALKNAVLLVISVLFWGLFIVYRSYPASFAVGGRHIAC